MGKLDGRVAIVTGSARGIGKAIALHFAREGADIVINDLRLPEMEATAREIRELGRKVLTVTADISTAQGAAAMVKASVDNFKKVDILVNNAGVPSRSSMLDVTEQEWDATHRVDLKGVFLCTQAVARHMMDRKYGKIINIASSAGLGSISGTITYAAAKAGVIQLTKTSARDLGPHGVNVNAIAPGRILTDMTNMGRTKEEVASSIANRIASSCMRRVGSPDDIAKLAVFLASDDSSFIAGQVIACDGGRMDRM